MTYPLSSQVYCFWVLQNNKCKEQTLYDTVPHKFMWAFNAEYVYQFCAGLFNFVMLANMQASCIDSVLMLFLLETQILYFHNSSELIFLDILFSELIRPYTILTRVCISDSMCLDSPHLIAVVYSLKMPSNRSRLEACCFEWIFDYVWVWVCSAWKSIFVFPMSLCLWLREHVYVIVHVYLLLYGKADFDYITRWRNISCR